MINHSGKQIKKKGIPNKKFGIKNNIKNETVKK